MYEEIHVNGSHRNGSSSQEHFAALVRDAAELRANTELAKYVIASQLTEDDLPPDLKAKVAAARAAVVPKSHESVESLIQGAQQYMRQSAILTDNSEELG